MIRPEPTGASHEVQPDELFFSTTDSKGIIKIGNSVFERLARYPAEKLIGAPHSIIRHPSMPGGAFRLMWDTLESGKPFCAYVDNLAGDGSRYTVFATITPLGDDYLSVRTRPCREDLLDAARSLYAAVRPGELQARADGVSAREAALQGLGQLAELLAGAGFPSYDEFIWVALPAEVLARAEAVGGFPRRSTRSVFGDILEAAGRNHERFRAWLEHLDRLQTTADALVAAMARMAETVATSEATADEFGALSGGFSPIMLSVNVWRSMIEEISEMNRALVERLSRLRVSCAQGRFLIALASLHNDAVGQFACEAIDGQPGPTDPGLAITSLVQALSDDVHQAAADLTDNAEQAAAASEEAEQLSGLVEMPTTLIDNWRTLAAADPDPRVAEMMPKVADVVDRGRAEAESLAELARQCRSIATPLDVQSVIAELRAIGQHLEAAA
ncbi:MAG: hypothetical protein Q4D79_14745 [Propionibacteriaceae bacterium]|nr:hypothetical protein [Propionibacteriaceae bacterium]